MDRHLRGSSEVSPQISFATGGGSGCPVPDLSVEVDDLADVHRRNRRGRLRHGVRPGDGALGFVRRFFVRDPFGRLLNILSHAAA